MILRNFNRIVSVLFLCTFGVIVLSLLVFPPKSYYILIFGILLLGGVLCGIYHWAGSRFQNTRERKLDYIFYCGLFLVLLLQLFAGYHLRFDPETDLGSVNAMAVSYGETGDFGEIYQNTAKVKTGYIARYPNNNGLFLFLCLVYRCGFLLMGKTSMLLPILINILALNLSIALTYKIAKLLFRPAAALFTGGLCFLFLPFYTYTPYFYTDSLSLPLVMGSLYLFIKAGISSSSRKKWLCFLLSGGIGALAFLMKGSAAILLAAYLLYLFFQIRNKRAVLSSIPIGTGFLVIFLSFQLLLTGLHFTNEEELEREQYPLTHWIMMGLKENGGFNQEDSSFTYDSGNYSEKKAATLKEIQKRLEAYGTAGLIRHLYQKARWTWQDGTYYISNHLNHGIEKKESLESGEEGARLERSALHEFFLADGSYYGAFIAYSYVYQLFLLLMVTLSAVRALGHKEAKFLDLLRFVLFGAFLFFLIWETRSRYLFQFTPILLLLSVDGIQSIVEFLRSKLTNNRKFDKILNS